MSALIGFTGFVGGHLQKSFSFEEKYNRSNVAEIQGLDTDLLVCAGLPAEKWIANRDPEADWLNMAQLAQLVSTVKAEKAILISTIDVFQPAIDVTESNQPDLIGGEAYGRNRAWFESVFKSTFSNSLIIRLPGLFGTDLKKNLIFDLLNEREEQYKSVDEGSKFQFFDMTLLSKVIAVGLDNKLSEINVATEPLTGQEIANIFDVRLNNGLKQINYRMKSRFDYLFGGKNGYLYGKDEVIAGISKLRNMEN